MGQSSVARASCPCIHRVTGKMPVLQFLFLCLVGTVFGADPPRNDGSSWPTLHGDLQRSGFYPNLPNPPLKLVWRKELWKELTGPRAEVIAADELAFMGTYAGNLYAWDIATGQQRWVFKTGGPIGHAPCYADGVLYVGSMDGRLYAIDAKSGQAKWHSACEAGIWVSPLVYDGKVYFGDRAGVFHIVKTDGTHLWSIQTGDRILNSPSLSEDGVRILFASEDMHVYCIDAVSGKLLWKSRKLAGLSTRDHFPVIHKGLAFVTTNPVKDFHFTLETHQQMLIKRTGFAGKDPRYIPGAKDDVRKEQDFILDHLKQHPEEQAFYAFRVEDGKEPWIAPVLYTAGLHNPHTPPCVNLSNGEVYTLLRTAYGVWDGGGEVRPLTGIGKIDLATGRVELIEHAHKSKEPDRPAGRKDMPWNTFHTIGDETQTLSCSADWLLSNHQGAIGGMNLKSGLTQSLFGKRDTYGGFYGAGEFGWPDQGGREKARAAGQPYGLVNEWHGPAKCIVSVAGKYVFYATGSQVMCLEGKP